MRGPVTWNHEEMSLVLVTFGPREWDVVGFRCVCGKWLRVQRFRLEV